MPKPPKLYSLTRAAALAGLTPRTAQRYYRRAAAADPSMVGIPGSQEVLLTRKQALRLPKFAPGSGGKNGAK
jgi:hypothetical protein